MSQTSTYTVDGMTCAHCVASVQEEVAEVAGVSDVDVDLVSRRLVVTADGPIDDKALDSLSVAPGERPASDERQQAGQDKSIAKRLEKHPASDDAKLDEALDESMDASDPPSNTQPGRADEPAASSGYDEEAERQRDA